MGSAPEVLMAAIAATTSRICIGSAGVMLPHYAPLKVAEQFRVLEALAPGRIDLGVGRAAQLRTLAESLDVDELVVTTWAHDPAAQRRSYELLAHEFL